MCVCMYIPHGRMSAGGSPALCTCRDKNYARICPQIIEPSPCATPPPPPKARAVTNIGVKSDALNPIVVNSLWNKTGLSSILYGSEVWYGLTKTETLMLDKVQTR